MSKKKNTGTKTFSVQKSELPQFDLFVQNCKKQDRKISPSIMALIISENLRLAGTVMTTTLNYEAVKTKVEQLNDDMSKIEKKLNGDVLANGRSAFEELLRFSKGLGAKFVERELHGRSVYELIYSPELKLKLWQYKYVGTESFEQKHLNAFIDYVEKKFELKPLQDALNQYRQNGIDEKKPKPN